MKRDINTLTIKYNYESSLEQAKEIIREKLEEAQDLIDMIQWDEIEISSWV